MEFFTALIFSYVIDGEYVEGGLWFDTEARCETALRNSDDLYETLYLLYEDTMATCKKSDIVSGYTIRPRLRPDNLMEKHDGNDTGS